MDEVVKQVRSQGMLFPWDDRFFDRRLATKLRQGTYEEREFAAVTALARPEDVVIELGAGMGFMSTACAVKCGCRAVHAFEANPRMIDYIRQVHALNGATAATVTNAVLGAEAGVAKFYIRGQFNASSLDADAKGAAPVIAVEEVPVVPIADTFRQLAPSFLVCDIEGAEAALLPLADLASVRCAVVELHPQWIGKAGVQAVFDAFAAAGLTFYPKTSNKKVVCFRRDW